MFECFIFSLGGSYMGDLGGAMLDPGGSLGLSSRDELKTQFMTREGTYHLMTLAEYSRPNRVGYANQAATANAPVKVIMRKQVLCPTDSRL